MKSVEEYLVEVYVLAGVSEKRVRESVEEAAQKYVKSIGELEKKPTLPGEITVEEAERARKVFSEPKLMDISTTRKMNEWVKKKGEAFLRRKWISFQLLPISDR